MRKSVMRYLDAQKLEWLIADNGLFFSAASNQSDKNEGIYDHTFLSRLAAQQTEWADDSLLDGLDKIQLDLQRIHRENNFLSCWYLDSKESMGMWSEFGKNGIVIFSDDWTLRDALPEPLEQATSYYDVIYSDELKPLANHEPLRIKNSKFQKEKEFRIVFDLTSYSILTGFEARTEVRVGGVLSHMSNEITSCMSPEGKAQSHKVLRRKGSGFIFDYPLNSVIKEVRAHPETTDENLQEIRVLLEGLGLKCSVNHSSLRTV